jgi:hypothetical protein
MLEYLIPSQWEQAVAVAQAVLEARFPPMGQIPYSVHKLLWAVGVEHKVPILPTVVVPEVAAL